MRSKSTLLLVAIGCFVWFAANREALEAQSKGEAATFDLWFPFLIPFGLAALVRAIYRKVTNGNKAPKTQRATEANRQRSTQQTRNTAPKGGEAFECGECRTQIPFNTKFCPECGKEFERDILECAYCDAEVNPLAKFCQACGKEFQKTALNNHEIEDLRIEIEAAEKHQKEVAQLAEIRAKEKKDKEAVREISLQLGHAESELRTLRSRDGSQLDGKQRIEFLKEQLEGTEKVERLKEDLKIAETKVTFIESDLKDHEIASTDSSSFAIKNKNPSEEKWVVPSVKDHRLDEENKWSSMKRTSDELSEDSGSMTQRRNSRNNIFDLRNSISKGELGTAALSDDASVRLVVAQNSHTSGMTISRLLSDPDDGVRQAAEEARDQSNRND